MNIKARCLEALRYQRERSQTDFVLDEINVLLGDRPPRTSREMRAAVKALRAEREKRDRIWRKKLLRKGLIRLGCLVGWAGGLIYSSSLGDTAALISCTVSVAFLALYYAHTQAAPALRAPAHQEGNVATVDGG